MTEILCKWLNSEVKLSKRIEPATFAADFSSGYLLGELLCKYGLQDDFSQFSQNTTSEAKLNNFSRIEPGIRLLQVPFDTNIARNIMNANQSATTRLLYELYIALSKKQQQQLTSVAMETMRPHAPAKLDAMSSTMYKERLKHITPRQSDLDMEELVSRYQQKQLDMEKMAFKEMYEEQERYQKQIQDQRLKLIQKFKDQQLKNSETFAKIQAATVHIPPVPPNKTAKAIAIKRQQRQAQEAKEVVQDIARFEAKQRTSVTTERGDVTNGKTTSTFTDMGLGSAYEVHEYINSIRKRLNEDANARMDREKRRRKVLIEQLSAHEAQEEQHREDVLVNLCMRQSIQERRIAVQLMQIRHEKENIRQNRLVKEKQFEESRLKEFNEALDKEAEMVRLYQLQHEEQIRLDRELHERLVAERAVCKYNKHYSICQQVASDIVDFSTKIAEYRELTGGLVPDKLMRDWTELLVTAKPLYADDDELTEVGIETEQQMIADERHQLLCDTDFHEYRNLTGEWAPPEGANVVGPVQSNPVLGYVIQRLINLVHPPPQMALVPTFPACPIKGCILGKTFSGKSTICQAIASSYNVEVLNVEILVAEAVNAYKCQELADEETLPSLAADHTSTYSAPTVQEDASSVSQTQVASKPVSSSDGKLQQKPSTADVKSDALKSPSGQQTSVTSNKSDQSVAVDSKTSEQLQQQGDESSEKSDPEKPVPVEVWDAEPDLAVVLRQLSPRAVLGQSCLEGFLMYGKPVSDELLVEIIVERIRRLIDGTGWILDGFPTTLAQAVLLEKALSGYDAVASGDPLLEPDASSKSKKPITKSSLVPDPRPPPPAPQPISGLDFVVLLDLPDGECLERAVNASDGANLPNAQSDQSAEVTNKDPSSSNNQADLSPARDKSNDSDQMQQRLASFLEEWPHLEKWYSKFGILRCIDACADDSIIVANAQQIIDDTLNKVKGVEPAYEFTEEELSEPKQPEPEKTAETPPAGTQPDASASNETVRSTSRSGSRQDVRKGSPKGKKEKKDEQQSPRDAKTKPGSPKRTTSPKRAGSPKKDGKKGKKDQQEEQVPVEPTGPPPPQPGSDEWVFVERGVDQELACCLVNYWETVEDSYIINCKNVFHLLRLERDQIIRYIYGIRQDFVAFLNRPDSKQQFVSQWQQEYNAVPDDMRADPEVRADLHQRADDLRDRLWNISDERKEQAEAERSAVMSNGWLDDHLGLLDNHYITLMQVEVDCFHDTVAILKDYYSGMEGRIPDEISPEYVVLPLVELPSIDSNPDVSQSSTAASPTPSEGDGKQTIKGQQQTTTAADKKPRRSLSPMNDTADLSAASLAATYDEKKPKIPLVQRRGASPDQGAKSKSNDKDSKDKAKSVKGLQKDSAAADETQSGQDVDEKLICDTYSSALAAVDKITAVEMAAREAEVEAEKQRLAAEEAARKKAEKTRGKGGKAAGAKQRTPSPKKGRENKESPTTPPPATEESEEDRVKRQAAEQAKIDKERGKQELMCAINDAAAGTRARIELIKAVALVVIQNLKSKADTTYLDMYDWIGAQYLQEMASVDQLGEVIRHAIEAGTKIPEELVIQHTEFFVNEDIKLVRTPTPPRPPTPVEDVLPDTFTTDQLYRLYCQFAVKQNESDASACCNLADNFSQKFAPITNNSIMPLRTFLESINSLAVLNNASDWLPAYWSCLPREKLEQYCLQLSVDGEYIDWRRFMLQIAHPWPIPSQSDLLDALAKMIEMDQKQTGCVTKEQFECVDIWLQGDPGSGFDRLSHLRSVIFDIFADHTVCPESLNYVQLLMYFSVSNDAYDGLLRALSVATGTHMPRLPVILHNRKTAVGADGEPSAVVSCEEHCPLWLPDIPDSARDAVVPIDVLHRVLCHGRNLDADTYRFSSTALKSENPFALERLIGVYQELGSNDLSPLPLAVLLENPVIQEVISLTTQYRAVDVRAMVVMHSAGILESAVSDA